MIMKNRNAHLLLLLLIAACVGCSNSSNKLEGVKKSGQLTVYTNANFPPFEYMEGSDVVGVDMELAQAIADEPGVGLNVQDADFDGLIASIASGKGDAYPSTLSGGQNQRNSSRTQNTSG